MRVVVTGAAGRVGRAIVAALADRHAVTGFDLLASPQRAGHVQGDIADPAQLRAVMDGADAVIHVAALHAPQVGEVDDARFVAVNVTATARLVELAATLGVPRLVYTSTTALYGAGTSDGAPAAWVDESTVPAPRTIYHRTKLAAEALLREAAAQGGPRLRILRMSRCFEEPAPRMVAYRLHRGVDVRDVAEAHRLALDDLDRSAVAAVTWVISAPTPFRRDDAAQLGRDAPAVIRARAPDVAALFAAQDWPLPLRIDRVYDAAQARAALGWQPRFGPMAAWRDGTGDRPAGGLAGGPAGAR